MNRNPVQSSNIAAIGFDPDTSELEIEFTNGNIYRYANVPADEHEHLIMAESLGRHFAARIKNQFECRKVVVLPVMIAGEHLAELEPRR